MAMELRICGTAAAEGIPAIFCACELCHEARRRGGKELRSRSAYQLGEHVRIDWGPDALHHALRDGLDYSRLRHLLVTHSHRDHWYPAELLNRRPGLSHLPENSLLYIHADEHTLAEIPQAVSDDPERTRIQLCPFVPWETVELEHEDISFTPIIADHAKDRLCVNFILRVGEQWILQGNDTGWYPDETWSFLERFSFDIVALDTTSGFRDEARHNHMGCATVIEAFDKLDAMGCLRPGCRRVATHFSHNGAALHDQLEQRLAPHGIAPAYDGMVMPLTLSTANA